MILDAKQLDLAQPLRTQVCIVGGGAAGITLACELDGAGFAVLLLDAGPIRPKAQLSQDPYVGSSDAPHAPPDHFRRRGFGGATQIWGGRCIPYEPIDFERRDYAANSGWPMAYDEVARHYPAAMAYLHAGAFEFSADMALPGSRPTLPGLHPHPELLTEAIERYSLPTDFARSYIDRLTRSTNVQLLGPAQALRLIPSASADRVALLECRLDEDGPLLQVQAEQFVLAMGGIETPRLLLASAAGAGGLGNRHDLVGRYYTCHIEKIHGVLRPRHPHLQSAVAFGFETTHDGVYARRKLQVHEQAQRRERLMNIAFRLHYPDIALHQHGNAVLSAAYLAKRTLIPEHRRILQHSSADSTPEQRSLAGHLRNVVTGLPQLLGFGVDWLQRRVLAERKLPYVLVPNADGSFPFEFNAEQTPLRDSRVRLSEQRDAYGMPRVHVSWRMCDDDIDSVARAYRWVRQHIEAGGAYALEFDEARLRDDLAQSFPVGGHHIGTVRMADHPRQGVVDRDGAVFDLPNLFIAGSATFPTSSHANPTLTIVAMAIRMAAHLRRLAVRAGALT